MGFGVFPFGVYHKFFEIMAISRDNSSSLDNPHGRRLGGWLRLFRPPNLLTVPGDQLAGFVMGGIAAGIGGLWSWTDLIFAMLAGVLLYAAGLASNDFFDLPADRRRRPGRPIPAGQVKPSAALAAAMILTAAGILFALPINPEALLVAAVLAIMIYAYNGLLKRITFVGPVAMGLCRGGSVLLGAAVAGRAGLLHAIPLAGAGIWVIYTAAVTQIARREAETVRIAWIYRYIPRGVLTLMGVIIGFWIFTAWAGAGTHARIGMLLAAVCAIASLCAAGVSYGRLSGRMSPPQVQATVGLLVRNLMFMQAAVVALGGGVFVYIAAILTAGWIVSHLLGRRFYAS